MTDLLIQNGTILSMDAGGEVLPGGAVAVRDGRIIPHEVTADEAEAAAAPDTGPRDPDRQITLGDAIGR